MLYLNILSEFTTLCEFRKSHVLFNKPIIIGFTILEIAKFEMNIQYDRFKKRLVIICHYCTMILIVLSY